MKVERIGNREIITEYTPEEWHQLRAKDITSTDAAALFGISPYCTEFELWHRKKAGTPVEIEPNERVKWGQRLEKAIAMGISEDNGEWNVWPFPAYIRNMRLSMGSSFDFEIQSPFKAILEIKNVDTFALKEGWIVDGDHVEAPPHIELQLQHQMAVAEMKLGYIGALVGGNRLILIRRERDETVINALESKIVRFWKSIDMGQPPEPNFQRDAKFISSLYRYAEPGKVIEGTDDIGSLVSSYKNFSRIATEAEKEKDAVKAQLLTKIGNAERVVGNNYSISTSMIAPTHIEYERKGYRDFKCYLRKDKP